MIIYFFCFKHTQTLAFSHCQAFDRYVDFSIFIGYWCEIEPWMLLIYNKTQKVALEQAWHLGFFIYLLIAKDVYLNLE